MDTFYEQIIKIKLDGKAKGMIAAIVGADLLLTAGLVFFALVMLGSLPLTLLIVGFAIFGAYKLLSLLSVEFEYAFTNGDLDFDKITAKSTRKRMASVKCATVEKFAEYRGQEAPGSATKMVFCNPDSEGQVYIIGQDKNLGTVMIVFAPDERIREAVEKAVPRIAKS